jgi:multidrug transporter EmrE-like cation transporter
VLAEAAGAVGAVLNPNGPLAALSFGSVSVLLLAIAVRELPAAVAYGVWAGGSTALLALLGAAFERQTPDHMLTLGVLALAVGSALLHSGRTARGRRPQVR